MLSAAGSGLFPTLAAIPMFGVAWRIDPGSGEDMRDVGMWMMSAVRPVMTGEPPRRDDDGNGGDGSRPGTGTATLTKPKTKKPSMYKVLMLNDDYTPMEFVVHVLERFFSKSREEATRIMLHVHQKGVGICGVYTYEVAETKVTQVMDMARKHQHPLQCTLEKE